MQTYIDQLIEDLKAAQAHAPSEEDYNHLDEKLLLEAHLNEVEMFVSREGPILEDTLGVEQAAFPPLEKLSDTQVEQLVEAILELWAAYHYVAELPHELPARMAYPLLVAEWEEHHSVCAFGQIYIEFCNYTRGMPFSGILQYLHQNMGRR